MQEVHSRRDLVVRAFKILKLDHSASPSEPRQSFLEFESPAGVPRRRRKFLTERRGRDPRPCLSKLFGKFRLHRPNSSILSIDFFPFVRRCWTNLDLRCSFCCFVSASSKKSLGSFSSKGHSSVPSSVNRRYEGIGQPSFEPAGAATRERGTPGLRAAGERRARPHADEIEKAVFFG